MLGRANLYRFRERPYVHLPAGVKLALRAPKGVSGQTCSALRLARCAAELTRARRFSVPGSDVRVARKGGHYELHITSKDQATTHAIQRRAGERR